MKVGTKSAWGIVTLLVIGAAWLAADVDLTRAQSGGGKPKYGTFGFDATGVDKATKPGDDFFRYANGAWVDRTEIPADKPAYSLRLQMTDLTEQRLHELMEQAA